MKRYMEKSLTLENIGTPYGRKANIKRTPEQTLLANDRTYYKKGYQPKDRDYFTYPGVGKFSWRMP